MKRSLFSSAIVVSKLLFHQRICFIHRPFQFLVNQKMILKIGGSDNKYPRREREKKKNILKYTHQKILILMKERLSRSFSQAQIQNNNCAHYGTLHTQTTIDVKTVQVSRIRIRISSRGFEITFLRSFPHRNSILGIIHNTIICNNTKEKGRVQRATSRAFVSVPRTLTDPQSNSGLQEK